MFKTIFYTFLALAGAQAAVHPDSIITLRMGGTVSQTGMITVKSQVTKHVRDEFLRRYPYIRLQASSSLRLRHQHTPDALRMALSGASAPDIIHIPVRNAGMYVRHGFMAPLDEFIAASGDTVGAEPYLAPAMKPILQYDGRTYFIHSSLEGTFLLYRRDRFAEAGLTRPPATWDELVEWARALTDPGTGRYGMVLYGTPSKPGWRWSNYLRMAGGNYYRRTAEGAWRANLDTPEAEKALALYRRLLCDPWQRDGRTLRGAARIVDKYFRDDFNEGRAAMMMGSAEYTAGLDPHLVGIAPLPRPAGGTLSTELMTALEGINAAIPNPRRQAAWDYLRFMHSRTADSISTALVVRAGMAGTLPQNQLDRYGYGRYTGMSEFPELKTIDSLARIYGVPEVHGPVGATNAYDQVSALLQRMAARPEDDYDLAAELRTVTERMNRIELGYTEPAVMKNRRRTTRTALALLAVFMLFVLVRYGIRAIVRAGARSRDPGRLPGGLPGGHGAHLWAWVMMLPAVGFILTWDYYPLLQGLGVAFRDYRVNGASPWVGIDNFVTAFWHPVFWQAFDNSLVYVGLTLLLGFALPILLALVLNELPRGAGIYRTLFYLPAVVGSLVVTMLWIEFYEPGPAGLFNRLMAVLGLPLRTWLEDPRLAMVCVVLPGVWATAGAGSILYQAALSTIHPALYEQADIDGAGITGKVWHVVLPLLRPLIIIQLVGAVIGAFHATQRILVMTEGGPDGATTTLGITVFRHAFIYLQYGYATAVAWLTGAFLIGFTVLQLNLFRRVRFTMRQGS